MQFVGRLFIRNPYRMNSREPNQMIIPKSQDMKQTIALIGVPSSAGAHWPGQEKAPQYLRSADLVARLEAVGLDVIAEISLWCVSTRIGSIAINKIW